MPVHAPSGSPSAAGGGELQIAQEVATEILGQLDVEAALLSVVNAAARLIDADTAGILLPEADGETFVMRACTGHRTVATQHLTARRGQGVVGKVLATRRPMRVDDYHSEPSISRDFDAIATQEGTRSALGALMVWRRRASVFTGADTRTLTHLADLATIAIVNARLYETERNAVKGLEEAHGRLAQQYAVLERSAQVHEELTALVLDGKGIAELVGMVAKHVGGPVAALDTDLQVLAETDDAGPLQRRALRHLRRAAEGAAHGTTLIDPDRRCARWLLLREVVADGNRLGYLLAAFERRPDQLDRVIVEQAGMVCALELTKQRAVFEARTRASAEFVWDVLEGKINDDAEAVVRAHHLGYTMPAELRVMVVSITGEPASTTGPYDAERRRHALLRTAESFARDARGSAVLAARRGPLMALILPATDRADETRAAARAILDGLGQRHPRMTFAAGVSQCVPWSADLRQPLSQAKSALSAAPLMAAGEQLALFNDLGVLRFLLAPGDRDELWAYARAILGTTIDYDEAHRTDLIDTVEAYLRNDCSLRRASAALFVHPKTVRYRLDRVQQLTGLDLSSQQSRFDLQLALTILQAFSLRAADAGPSSQRAGASAT